MTVSIPPFYNLLIGYLLSMGIGLLVVDWFVDFIRSRSEALSKDDKAKQDKYLVRILGALELFFYTSCVIINQPAGIAAWLAIKVVTRWTSGKDKERWETISKNNIYLIGNLLIVIFGVAGGVVSIILPR